MMKGYWQLTLAQLRLFARNRQVLIWTMLFPILLMVMLGSFLGKGPSVSLSVALIDQDGTAASGSFIEDLTETTVIEFERNLKQYDALSRLEDGDLDLVIIIPKGYGEQLAAAANGGSASIQLYYDEQNMLVNQLGIPVVEQTIDGIIQQLADYRPVISVEAEPVESLELNYTDFIVPGIVAMMIMSNNLNGVAGQIASWRERGVLRRMQSTTLRASTFIAAQITARLLLNGMQAFVVLLVGFFFFGTQVNGSWLLLILFVVLGTLAFMAIGFIIAGLAKTPESAGPIAGVISFPLLFLGGVFFPIENMPDWFQPIVNSLPIAQLATSLREIMNVGASLLDLWFEFTLLCVWMVAAFFVASRTFRWD